MIDNPSESVRSWFERTLGKQRLWLHIVLFLASFITTTVAGEMWRGIHDPFDIANLHYGVAYACFILLFLSSHEFGHFIAARIHKVDATLPYFIPFPGYLYHQVNFGTLGAVIRTRSRVPSNKVMFDIGVAGPIAGFIACLIILAIGFSKLPGIEYLQQLHPGYPRVAYRPGQVAFGNTLLFSSMAKIFASPHGYIPSMSEVPSYPMLCAGWFGLFVTALNLLPVGQLDGGHLTYTLFGRVIHRRLGQLVAIVLFAISIPAFVWQIWPSAPQWIGAISIPGGETWLLWAIITTFVIKFRHPVTDDESPLDPKRKLIGYFAIAIFVLCFTPSPLLNY